MMEAEQLRQAILDALKELLPEEEEATLSSAAAAATAEGLSYCGVDALPEAALPCLVEGATLWLDGRTDLSRVSLGDYTVVYRGGDWRRKLGRWRRMVF